MPSRASCDANTLANPACSAAMPSSRSPAPETRLICSIASGACAGQPPRPRQGGVEQFVILDHAVDQAQLEGLLGEDRIADQVHLQGLALPDQARQSLGAAEAGDDPELDLRLTEQRRARGDADVAGHRQLAAAAEREAVDRGDRGDAGLADLAQQRMRAVPAARARRTRPSS